MKKKQNEVEEWIQRYPSVERWFIEPNGERHYASSTEKEYIGYMKLWCRFTGKTPDELANCEDIDKERGVIAEGMREQLHLAIRSVTDRTNALNGFWKRNGRRVKETYGGIPKPLRRDIERLRKWRSEER